MTEDTVETILLIHKNHNCHVRQLSHMDEMECANNVQAYGKMVQAYRKLVQEYGKML